jgi:hypothetical protein
LEEINMSKQMTNEQVFQKISEDYAMSVEEVGQKYSSILEGVKADERFANADQATLEQIARNRLITRIRREAASPAITWEGMIFGAGDLIDGVGKQRRLSEEAFKVDPVKTQAGWVYQQRLVMTNENGDPLYPKTESNDKWGRTGKPLPEHSWMRTVYGVAQPLDKKTNKPTGEIRPFQMTLSDKRAVEVKSLLKGKYNKPIHLKGIDKTKTEHAQKGEYYITDSAFTTFELAPDVKMPEPEVVISTALKNNVELLGNLEEYHAKNAESWDRWVIVEGNVSLLNLEPNPKTQNMMMILDDESLLFAPKESGNTGVACWIPIDRGIEIDFCQDSRVYVVGRTTQGKKRDPITRQLTDEPGDVNINVFGIYCPEMFKVCAPAELPEDALDAEPVENSPEGEEW